MVTKSSQPSQARKRKRSHLVRKPCDNCPWRKDAPTRYWHPDHFKDIWASCQDDGTNMMLCHKTNEQTPEARKSHRLICQGWLRVMGFDAIGVRLAVIQGYASAEEVNDRKVVPTATLYPSFAAMLEANGITPPRRNRWVRIKTKQPRRARRPKSSGESP
jgi:hypothetical protein